MQGRRDKDIGRGLSGLLADFSRAHPYTTAASFQSFAVCISRAEFLKLDFQILSGMRLTCVQTAITTIFFVIAKNDVVELYNNAVYFVEQVKEYLSTQYR